MKKQLFIVTMIIGNALFLHYDALRGMSAEQEALARVCERHKKIVDAGNPVSKTTYAWMHENGYRVVASYTSARILYEEVVEANDDDDGEARYFLGCLYQKGLGVKQNSFQARSLYRRAWEYGNADIQLLALEQLKVLTGNPSIERELSEKYPPQEILMRGFLLEKGVVLRGKAPNYAQACECYERAAARGNGEAMYCLGRMYQLGLGIERDLIKAKELYTKALHNTDDEFTKTAAQRELDMMQQESGLWCCIA